MNNAQKFNQIVGQILSSSSKKALDDFNVFHATTQFRLEAAEFFLKKLQDIKSSEGYLLGKLHRESRFYLEVFFIELYNALDSSFLQEVNLALGLGLNPKDVNPGSINGELKSKRIKNTAVERFNKLRDNEKTWLWELMQFRHRASHREMAGFHAYKTVGAEDSYVEYLRHPVDSNRRTDKEVIPYCEEQLEQMKQLLDNLYGDFVQDINAIYGV